jgi:uncharacterized caspase-like protein
MNSGEVKSARVAFGAVGLLLCATSGPAFAERMALVVGSAQYDSLPSLKNAASDARGVKDALEKIGFKTELVIDAEAKDFRARLREFSGRIADAEAVVFFYVGRVYEVNKIGYLLLKDVAADAVGEPDASQAPSFDEVATALGSSPGVKLLIVDSCIDVPKPAESSVMAGASGQLKGSPALRGRELRVREPSRASPEAADQRPASDYGRDQGMLIAFSTATTRASFDGDGPLGPFAASMIRHLSEPGVSVQDLLREVNADAIAQKSGQRTKFLDSLRSPYTLNSDAK